MTKPIEDALVRLLDARSRLPAALAFREKALQLESRTQEKAEASRRLVAESRAILKTINSG